MLQAHATVPAESAAPGTAWYVCLTKRRQEAMAAKRIQAQGDDFCMPTLRRWQRLASGWRYKDEVLFPVTPLRGQQTINVPMRILAAA